LARVEGLDGGYWLQLADGWVRERGAVLGVLGQPALIPYDPVMNGPDTSGPPSAVSSSVNYNRGQGIVLGGIQSMSSRSTGALGQPATAAAGTAAGLTAAQAKSAALTAGKEEQIEIKRLSIIYILFPHRLRLIVVHPFAYSLSIIWMTGYRHL
jgi:hypothetical protein